MRASGDLDQPGANYKRAYFAIGCIIFTYVLLRAILVDITFDEVWTIESYVPLDILHILNFTPCDPNNHLLNTLLVKLFQNVFGTHTFIARLPNVLACSVYLFYAYKIAAKFLRPVFGLLLFVALFSNPFVLDFFGLARGYGLALAFMSGSLYYLLNFLNTYEPRFAQFSLILAGFAVLSNFALINYAMAACFAIHFSHFVNKNKSYGSIKLLGVNLLIIAVFSLIVYEPLRKLLRYKSLSYGGSSDFYSDTLTSLTAFSLYHPYDVQTADSVLKIFIVIFFAVIVASLWGGFRFTRLLTDRRFLIAQLLIFSILCNIMLFYFTGTLYPIDRMALSYYPLIIITFFFWANDTGSRLIKFSKACVILIAAALMFNQIRNLNFVKTIGWEFDSRTTTVLSYLNNLGIKGDKKIYLDSSWPFRNGIRYYLERGAFEEIIYVGNRGHPGENRSDYYLYYDKPLLKVDYDCKLDPVHGYEKDTVLAFPDEAVYLVQPGKCRQGEIERAAAEVKLRYAGEW